jgi:hypothetical protein
MIQAVTKDGLKDQIPLDPGVLQVRTLALHLLSWSPGSQASPGQSWAMTFEVAGDAVTELAFADVTVVA